MANSSQLPLSELSPMGIRRNSPSFPQGNKGNIFKGDSSPFNSSPFNANPTSSPRLFWRGRDPASPAPSSSENRTTPFEIETSPSPPRRSSIENLKKASRVKNSSMFEREQKNVYDPSQPALVDRPLASGRPLSIQVQGNSFGGRGIEGMRYDAAHFAVTVESAQEHESEPSKSPYGANKSVRQPSPSRNSVSPTKSSLAKRAGVDTRDFGSSAENDIWYDDEDFAGDRKLPEGRGLHYHAKSVTFDQAPPQVNEYEMTTPAPSSVASNSRESSYDTEQEEVSYERGSSLDREDSFDASLEDVDKTPVVLPEDWRFMNPEHGTNDLAQHEDDPFEDRLDSPEPSAHPGLMEYRDHQASLTSVDSNGQPRPLPPVPAINGHKLPHSESDNNLSVAVERISSTLRSLPPPPKPAYMSKSDIRRMSSGSVSMEDRLRLMMLQDQAKETEGEKQRERKARRCDSKENSPTREPINNGFTFDFEEPTEQEQLHSNRSAIAPRISRESILKELRSQQDQLNDDSYEASSSPISSPARRFPGQYPEDPNFPIPSLEDPIHTTVEETTEEEIAVKDEYVDEDSLYSVPELPSEHLGYSPEAEECIVDHHNSYPTQHVQQGVQAEDGQDTPRALSPEPEPEKKNGPQSIALSLPILDNPVESNSFDLGFRSYLSPQLPQPYTQINTPSTQQGKETAPLPDLASVRAAIVRTATPEEQLEPPRFPSNGSDDDFEPGTPDSVIRRPILESPSSEYLDAEFAEIPLAEATIKAPGGDLKTRPSLTPADAETMAANRRKISGQSDGSLTGSEAHHQRRSRDDAESQDSGSTVETESIDMETKRVPSLVQLELPKGQGEEGLGLDLEKEFDRVVETQKVAFQHSLANLHYPLYGRFPSENGPVSKDNPVLRDTPILKPGGARPLPGDQRAADHHIPVSGGSFANRSPARQRGYLMRHNTKIVVASNNHLVDEPKPVDVEPTQEELLITTSPRKISQPTWTAEPWNGKHRRKSIRATGDHVPRRKPADGVAPPLPGQVSNVQESLVAVQEDEAPEEEAEEIEDGVERGRLFVRVVGMKELNLPLPRGEKTFFALTLDNGLHCVTTSWLDLGKEAPIGQEFELVVLNELEFQLTLQMKYEEPKVVAPVSTTKPASPVKKQGTFSRLFGSPKKRKELELRQQEEAASMKSPVKGPPSAYEMVQGIVGKDGSFARAYIALSEYEQQSFGRPHTVDITCFNEWAMEEVTVGSSRSKKGVVSLQRKPPYPIGKLELQLLYVPKPNGTKEEDLPKSMNGAVRELKDAEVMNKQTVQVWAGHLSQQGGDCPFWRRRFFKLVGHKLTAFHEATLQPRATINLAKASKLIDDRSALTKKEISTKGGARRKSAFAEEEEGYMFVEEGFRIRFLNGEVIDFYADTAQQKDEWMKALSQVVGKITPATNQSKAWTEVVLKREKSTMMKERKSRPRVLSQPEPPVKNDKDMVREHVETKSYEQTLQESSTRSTHMVKEEVATKTRGQSQPEIPKKNSARDLGREEMEARAREQSQTDVPMKVSASDATNERTEKRDPGQSLQKSPVQSSIRDVAMEHVEMINRRPNQQQSPTKVEDMVKGQMEMRVTAREQGRAPHAAVERMPDKQVGQGFAFPPPSGSMKHHQPPSQIPRQQPRPGHSRTESYQHQSGTGSRSQASSPVKQSREARYAKTRSMIDMHFR